MLDTNTVSYIARGRSAAARKRLVELGAGETACVSAMTEAEIWYELRKRPEASALQVLMEDFLASVQVLAWGREEAKVYGALRARLERARQTLGGMDLMITAHAVASGAVLVTNDMALLGIEGLAGSENWASDLRA